MGFRGSAGPSLELQADSAIASATPAKLTIEGRLDRRATPSIRRPLLSRICNPNRSVRLGYLVFRGVQQTLRFLAYSNRTCGASKRGFLADSITYMAAKMGDNLGNAALQNLYPTPHMVETARIHSVPESIHAGGNQGILHPGLRFRMRTPKPKERCSIHEHAASFENSESSPVAVFFRDSRYCSAGDRFMRASDGPHVTDKRSTPLRLRFPNAGHIRNPKFLSDTGT